MRHRNFPALDSTQKSTEQGSDLVSVRSQVKHKQPNPSFLVLGFFVCLFLFCYSWVFVLVWFGFGSIGIKASNSLPLKPHS
jgi:hypothetical protein